MELGLMLRCFRFWSSDRLALEMGLGRTFRPTPSAVPVRFANCCKKQSRGDWLAGVGANAAEKLEDGLGRRLLPSSCPDSVCCASLRERNQRSLAWAIRSKHHADNRAFELKVKSDRACLSNNCDRW